VEQKNVELRNSLWKPPRTINARAYVDITEHFGTLRGKHRLKVFGIKALRRMFGTCGRRRGR
jgi:hypothetical protein